MKTYFDKAGKVIEALQGQVDRHGDLPIKIRVRYIPDGRKRPVSMTLDITSVSWGASGDDPGEMTITADAEAVKV